MPKAFVSDFDGQVPRTEAHLLADNQAQVAQNTKLYNRALRPWTGTAQDVTVAALANVKTIYKLYDYVGNNLWLQWTTDVDVALSPQADTGDIRYYYTGSGIPKKSNYAMATGGQFQNMGVPAPVAAPSLTYSTVGSGSTQTRAYVYTFVNSFGTVKEESAPSPPATLDVAATGSTVTVSLFDAAPAGAYNVTAIRIYRSVTGATTASYDFVGEIPISTTTFVDNLTVAQLGEALPSLGWLPPPADMAGICNLGSGTGVLCGFSGNTVYFSEPFFPHAWPLAYALTVPYKIVGIGVFGTSVVVCTDRYPFIISGGVPGAMSVERVPILEPCVSKLSVAAVEDGVIYASPNGLITIGSQARGNTVRDLYHREEWEAMQPANLTGVVYGGRYVGAFTAGPMQGKAIVLDPSDRPALCTVDISGPRAVHVDSKNARLYFVDLNRTGIFQLDVDPNSLLSYTWRSKRWVLPCETSWSVGQLRGDFTAGTTTIKVYADHTLVATITPTNDGIFRLPPFRCREFEFELTGTRTIFSVGFGTSTSELRS